jgi:pilus assembly protein CpaC
VNKHYKPFKRLLCVAACVCVGTSFAQVQTPPAPVAPAKSVARPGASAAAAAQALQPCASAVMDPPSFVTLGKSSIIRLSTPIARMLVGGQPSSRTAAPVSPVPAAGQPTVPVVPVRNPDLEGVGSVDITLLSPTELFFLGKKAGSMNVILQSADGRCFIRDIIIAIDPGTLQAKLGELMPEESGIKVRGAENALVLSGQVSDAVKLDQVMSLATSYGDGKKVVNLLRIMTPQQVMLEVKIAEVSKTLLDRFGIDYTRLLSSNGSASVLSGVFGGAPAVLGKIKGQLDFAGSARGAIGSITNGAGGIISAPALADGAVGRAGSATFLGIDAQKRDGLIRVLAEPNIMAISGQQASFLSGGRIFIPVAQSRDGGGSSITLEEKEFGVGLKFMPTVLDGTRVNLKLVSEVSELAQTGSAFTTVGGVTSVLPSITSRRVDTTVQLNDGQSFAIAGLIKNNITETISRFPGLGEVPVLGALFRSTEFQKDQTELIFVVTPRLVKPMVTAIALPTDNLVEPNRAEVLFMGVAEGKPKQSAASETPAPTESK